MPLRDVAAAVNHNLQAINLTTQQAVDITNNLPRLQTLEKLARTEEVCRNASAMFQNHHLCESRLLRRWGDGLTDRAEGKGCVVRSVNSALAGLQLCHLKQRLSSHHMPGARVQNRPPDNLLSNHPSTVNSSASDSKTHVYERAYFGEITIL